MSDLAKSILQNINLNPSLGLLFSYKIVTNIKEVDDEIEKASQLVENGNFDEAKDVLENILSDYKIILKKHKIDINNYLITLYCHSNDFEKALAIINDKSYKKNAGINIYNLSLYVYYFYKHEYKKSIDYIKLYSENDIKSNMYAESLIYKIRTLIDWKMYDSKSFDDYANFEEIIPKLTKKALKCELDNNQKSKIYYYKGLYNLILGDDENAYTFFDFAWLYKPDKYLENILYSLNPEDEEIIDRYTRQEYTDLELQEREQVGKVFGYDSVQYRFFGVGKALGKL